MTTMGSGSPHNGEGQQEKRPQRSGALVSKDAATTRPMSLENMKAGAGQTDRSALHLVGGKAISRKLATMSVYDANWVVWAPETSRDRNSW